LGVEQRLLDELRQPVLSKRTKEFAKVRLAEEDREMAGTHSEYSKS
jgi:hypothetical protein